ncbi:unnamed protein product [Hymenolepis diminuta]|uniref:Centrosomal protein of 70 kDa n=1 Tax=Hymenolepis diminuta TaxID=6216 RepID=A0A158QF06_HYMDI|nr:unnamed protein product [Hymenolepis diminuta]
MDERYKNLVDWMHVIVTSTKPPSSTQEEYDFSNDAVQRLKTEIASSITQSRENAVLIEELNDNISSKDLQISHLKSVISQLSSRGIRRLEDNFEEAQRESETMNATRIENSSLKKRLNYLELQLEEARNQLCQYEEKSSREKVDALKVNINFRQSLSNLLNHSAWVCSDSEEEILEVIRRVLTALTNKAEACSRLQIQSSELASQLAESERKFEHLENELLTLRAKQCRSLTKSVEFLDRTTYLDDSHERLLQFLRQLENRLPVDQSVFDEMSVADRRNFILDYVSKACTPSPAKSESELAPRLHKRVQRLQDDLVSRDLQLKTWQNKVAKLEEQLVLARKGEAEAVEKQTLAEQRANRLKKNEMETNRLKNEALQLKLQLKDKKDAKERLEESTQRVLQLEESVRNLEELKLRQANRIGELITCLETEKAATTKKLRQQEEEQRERFNTELREVNQMLDELRTESEELHNFRDIVGRLLGMRVDDLDEPSKEILHGVEKLLKESGSNSLHRSTTFIPRSISPRRVARGSSARMGSTHGKFIK